MSRIRLVSLVAYAIFIVGLATRSGKVLALVIPFLLFLGAALWYRPAVPKIRTARKLSEVCISPGKEVTVTLLLENEGEALEEILVEDLLPRDLQVVEGKNQVLAPLPHGARLELVYRVRGRRGNYRFNQVRLTVTDALALFKRTLIVEAFGQIFIKPEVLHLRSIAIRPLRTHLYTGPIPSRRGGAGVNFFEVRQYSIGDPLRRVNWKATARHGDTLYSNQFEQERVADVGLILDARAQTDLLPRGVSAGERDGPNGDQGSALSLFDYSVQAAASLSDVFLRDGHRVGLLIYGRGQQATFPGYGKTQRERILRALAQARTGDNMALESLVYLPTRFFPPKSQILLVSPIHSVDTPVLVALLAHGYQVLVVSPDPISYELQYLQPSPENELALRLAEIERTLMIRKLQRYGVRVINWPIHQPLERALRSSQQYAPLTYRRIGAPL